MAVSREAVSQLPCAFEWHAVYKLMLFRVASCALLLSSGSFCFAQNVTVRVVNGKNGHPLQNQLVTLSLEYGKGEHSPTQYDAQPHTKTDAHGEARFSLPEPAPSHLGVQVLGLPQRHWDCRCVFGVKTTEVIQKGTVAGPAVGLHQPAKSMTEPGLFKPTPGEILLAVRPVSFFEWLFYPLYGA